MTTTVIKLHHFSLINHIIISLVTGEVHGSAATMPRPEWTRASE